MRRTSDLAVEISNELTRAGLTVTPRRLEGWSLAGLGPDERLPIAQQVAHCRALAEVGGPGRGRSADVAARRLAAHGYVCPRLRGALLRGCHISENGESGVQLDFSTEQSADAAFAYLDEVADGISQCIDDLPSPLRAVARQFRSNVYQSASGMGESGEVVMRSAIVNMLGYLLGGEIYDQRPIAAMLGVEQTEVDDDTISFINQSFRIVAGDVDEAYRSAPLDEIAMLARWIRERAQKAATFLGLTNASEAHLDELSVLFAPYAWYVLKVLISRFDDTRDFVSALELPVALVSPELSLSA